MEFTFSYKLQSCDGFLIEVKREVIRQSSMLDNMIRDLELDGDDDLDPLAEPIMLPRITGPVLKKVIEWCDHHKHDGPFKEDVTGRETFEYQIPTWDLEYFNIDKALLYQIIMAANYLEIRGLLDLGHKHIALMMKGKSPEEIRTIFNVTNDVTPEEETEIDQLQMNIHFGLVYNILKCFDRRELCHLRNVNRRHYIVIERKFGISPPYLVFKGQRLSESSWEWWPSSGKSLQEIPSAVRDQLPTSKFVRFKSSELQLGNPNESNIDVLSMSHVWENEELIMVFSTSLEWNEKWACMAAKALYVEITKDLVFYLRQLTSGNCVRLSLTDWFQNLYTVEFPWSHILDFLFKLNTEGIEIHTKNPSNHYREQMLKFIEQVKQKFLDSLAPVGFSFEWSWTMAPTAFNGEFIFDDFVVENQRTKQCLRFDSTDDEFELTAEKLDY